MSLDKLLKSAKALSQQINNGKEFSTKHVSGILAKKAEENPSDIMIHVMRDVITKKASTQNFISQKEIGELYSSLVNYSGGERSTVFRTVCAGLLPQTSNTQEEVKKDASSIRGGEQHVKTLQEYDTGLEKMAQEFSGIFSLNNKGSFSGFSDNTSNKAKKFAKVQLDSMGCHPKQITITAENEHFVLCKAAFETGSFREVTLDIPVQVSGGVPKLPSHFISDGGGLEKLSKENLLVALKSKEDHKKFSDKNKFASSRSTNSIKIDNVTAPKALDHLTNIEDKVLIASSKFDNSQVELARNVLGRELKSVGLNAQLKFAGSNDRGVVFMSKIANSTYEFPVEFSSGRPLMPSHFVSDNKRYDFSSTNLRKVASLQPKSQGSFELRKEAYQNMSYHQLVNEMITSVDKRDFGSAEDALSSIQSKFDGTQVIHAVQKYASLLKTAGMNDERETLIKMALQRGDLIRVPTSLDLYAPKFGLPLSKLAFDGNGQLVPLSRVNQRLNMDESQVFGISSHQIKIN
jgi:hypothetical protein